MCTEQQFLKDVATHQMRIVRDDGVHRHLQFRRPESYCMGFDLITWPGYLCYTGDMGTYVFQRLKDMFQFFRTDLEHQHLREGQTLAINLGYWGEKLQAADRHDGFRKWSKEKFEKRIREDFDQWLADNELTVEQKEEAVGRFEDEIIAGLDDGVQESAYRAAMDFEVEKQLPFEGWWEVDTEEYTHRFVWCCYALAWGIQQYDNARQHAAAA